MCVAAPILSDSGTLQGILSIFDTKTNYDRQSMALAISTAKAIENEILMSKINRSLSNAAQAFIRYDRTSR